MASKFLMPNPNNKSYVSLSSTCPKSSSSSHYSSSGKHLHLPKKPETQIATSIDVSASPISTPTTKETTSKRVISKMSILTHFWKEIQGFNNWENLIQPLHPLLRKEIIRYGELVTACYKAFDLDSSSRRYLNCKYGKKNMFNDIGLPNSGYHVTKYIYATPDINMSESCGRWIGYIAVSDDEDSIRKLGRRDIVICFRGTVTSPEWKANLMSSLTPARLDPHNPRPEVKVESGFLSLYTSDERSFTKFGVGSCREQLLSEVSRLLNKYKGEELSITLAGHSMGSSLALLLAYDISELGLNNILHCNGHSCSTKIPITVFSHGGPRVGNKGFKDRLEELGVKVLRIVNANDPITKLPGVVFNENLFRVLAGMGRSTELPADPWRWSSSNCYSHVGVELLLDFFNMHNLSCVHDLETYINLLRYPHISNHKNHHQEGSRIDFVDRARKLMVLGAQNLNVLPLRNAANNMMMSLVQSQRT